MAQSTGAKAYEKMTRKKSEGDFTALFDLSVNGTSVPLLLSNAPAEPRHANGLPEKGDLYAFCFTENADEARAFAAALAPAMAERRATDDDDEDLNLLVFVTHNESERMDLFEELRPAAGDLTKNGGPMAVLTDSLSLLKGDEPFSTPFARLADGPHTLIDFDGNKPVGKFKCG